MNRNYSKELEKILKNPENRGKRLFLHSCCAPCSSYVLEYLRAFFRITVFYYNPNITEDEEYFKRVEEQKRLIFRMNESLTELDNVCGGDHNTADIQDVKHDSGTEPEINAYPIDVVEGAYEKTLFFDSVKGLEHCPEGGERCFICYEMRLRETAKRAKETGADYFTTTLTISPLKNATKLNEIGEQLSVEYGIDFLPSDFKKKGGYQRSIELSKEYDLYRQDYCGCIYSKVEREKLRKLPNM